MGLIPGSEKLFCDLLREYVKSFLYSPAVLFANASELKIITKEILIFLPLIVQWLQIVPVRISIEINGAIPAVSSAKYWNRVKIKIP